MLFNGHAYQLEHHLVMPSCIINSMYAGFTVHAQTDKGCLQLWYIWQGITFGSLADQPANCQIKIRHSYWTAHMNAIVHREGYWWVWSLGFMCERWMTCCSIDSLQKLACQHGTFSEQEGSQYQCEEVARKEQCQQKQIRADLEATMCRSFDFSPVG